MPLLEYSTYTVPKVVKKAIKSFYNRDPLMNELFTKNLTKLQGGTHIRFKRVISGHSNLTEITSSNLDVDWSKRQTMTSGTGDWGRFIKAIILPHPDASRMQSAEDKAEWVKDMTTAAMSSLRNQIMRRIYLGSTTGPETEVVRIGTLNGFSTNGTASGFENGAIRFQTPTAQAAASIQYLNMTRVEDTTNFWNNWYNQWAQHTGIGTDALRTIEQVKATAFTFDEEGDGITLGIMSIPDFVALGEEARSDPASGGVSAVQYTVADVDKGNLHRTVIAAGGVRYYPNRWMTTTAGPAASVAEPIYLLCPEGIAWWVNRDYNFQVSAFFDGLHAGKDADIGHITLEAQFAVENLLANGGVSQ